MNVLVFGAAGKTGSLIVKKAVSAGHMVTAFVRNANQHDPLPGVRVLSGDATNPTIVSNAVNSQDAVIDTIGGKTPWRKTEIEQTVARAIVTAVGQNSTRRIIAISALGVGDSTKQAPFWFRLLVLPTFLRGSTADKAAMERVIKHSGVPYILVRPAILNDQPATGSVRVLAETEKGQRITRADLASFVVEQLVADTYLNQTVAIANS